MFYKSACKDTKKKSYMQIIFAYCTKSHEIAENKYKEEEKTATRVALFNL